MKSALVTGATGFIGGHLVRQLTQEGWYIRCLIRSAKPPESLEGPHIQCVQGDITEPATLKAAVAGVSTVFHLASLLKMPWHSAFRTVNVDGSRHVAEACVATDSKPTLIHLSSLAAAGPARDASPLNETQPPAPVSRYGKVKLASEQAVASVASHLPVTIVRPPMVYGAGDPSTQKLFRGIDRGWHILPTRKDTLLSTIHVEDLVEGLVQLADSGERLPDEQTLGGKGLYYLSSHDPITFADLGLAIATALERPAPRIIRLPLMATRSVAALVELGARLRSRPSLINLDKIKEAAAGHWLCSSDKATRHVGFSTRPLVERLKQTAHWYLETRTSA